jgi:hypothetical protein
LISIKHAVLAAAVAGTAVTVTTPAHATSTSYCPYGASVSGNIAYTPALAVHAPAVQPTTWTLNLRLVCTGMAPSEGTYNLTINGRANENCEGGVGGGTVANGGTKTNAGLENGTIVGGGWTYTRSTVHYYGYPGSGDGNITVVNTLGQVRTFTMYLWLDIVIPTNSVYGPNCPGTGGQIIGHGTMLE